MPDSTSSVPASSGHTGTVIGMGACYALGTFTDNFYKQAAILMAAVAGMTGVQSVATVLFSLPFVLFSAWGGAVADRVAKKNIVVAVKTVEFISMFLGGYMLLTQNWWGILAVVFLMGTQSTFFSPAINGAIPETFPPEQVPRANALIKLASTAAILAGFAMAGLVLDITPESFRFLPALSLSGLSLAGEAYGRAMAGAFVVGVALLGLFTAFTLRRKPAAEGLRAPFPWSGPVQSVKHTVACRADKSLMLALVADSWFYGIAAIAVISIANLAARFGYSKSLSGLMMALLMIGVAAGAVMGGRFRVDAWRRVILPVGSAMAAALLLVSLSPAIPAEPFFALPGFAGSAPLTPQFVWFGATLFLTGFFGGMYIIPLESFIQVRPAAHEKGKVIGVSNFMSFMAMAVFGAAFKLIGLLPPALNFAFYGLATFLFLWLVARRMLAALPETTLRDAAFSPLGLFLRIVLSLRYRVTETGLDAIAPPAVTPQPSGNNRGSQSAPEGAAEKKPGMLILPNHPALIDPVLIYSRLAGLAPRPLSDENQMKGAVQGMVARLLRVVTIPDLERGGRGDAAASARRGLENITNALKNGDNVLLYPSGRVYRSSREKLGNNSAVARILEDVPGARVLLARTTGLWGSSFGYASGKAPHIMHQLLRGVLTIFANLLFFTPRRAVTVEFMEPETLPRNGDKLALNRCLESFYNETETPPILVPRFFWQRKNASGKTAAANRVGDAAGVPSATGASGVPNENKATTNPIPDHLRDEVYAVLRERGSLPEDHQFDIEQNLSDDLYFDSLSLMESAMELEERFGHAVSRPEDVATVGDCLKLAAGLLHTEEAVPPADVPEAWLAPLPDAAEARTVAPGAASIVDAFLTLARENPAAPLTVERSGMRTRKEILTGMLALSRHFAALPGKRLGIMLPGVPASLAVWLAAMHAGKEPVFLNWTVGRRNLEHCIRLAGVTHVVSASALMDQIRRTGTPLDDLPVTWLAAERLAKSLSVVAKLRAALGAALHCSPLPVNASARRVPETAAILFTSGSEARPKGVPLSHTNIMTNAADVLAVLKVTRDDKVLAMLPPFHSFGLLVGMALPAATGIPAAYHPNPTESAHLNAMVRDFKTTLLGATPTFLDAMLAKARGTQDLAALRFAFAGAEKCPEHVYRSFAAVCPDGVLCEGYGITECSPVVAVNRPESPVAGSIGHVLPAVEAVMVREEDDDNGDPVITGRANTGETAMLLVRGPSVFSGYLAFGSSAFATGGEGGYTEPPPSPFVRFEGKDWYRTGDLLAMDETGRLVFRGRRKRFVKIGGEMISLPQMEDVLQQAFAARVPAQEEGKPFIAVTALKTAPDTDAVELAAFTTLPLDVAEANRALRAGGLSPMYAVRSVARLAAIPLLGSGKTDYRALQKGK